MYINPQAFEIYNQPRRQIWKQPPPPKYTRKHTRPEINIEIVCRINKMTMEVGAVGYKVPTFVY